MTRQLPNRAHLQHALLAGLCALAACTPNSGLKTPYAATGFCVKPTDICTPDPGAPPVDCAAAEKGIEFAPTDLLIADFEKPSDGDYVAEFMYSYTDATAQIYANYDGKQIQKGYEPYTTAAKVCNTDTNNHVLHVTGGHEEAAPGDAGRVIKGAPFLSWGGGLGVSLYHFARDRGLCLTPGSDDPLPESARSPHCQHDDAGVSAIRTSFNLSDWDGVAVWARRGPDSQPLLRVLVGNKYVDEDVSFFMYRDEPAKTRYCERVLECACTNGKPCVNWTIDQVPDPFLPGHYCGDPASDPAPGAISGVGVTSTNKCDRTKCDDIYPAFQVQDKAFVNRPCTPYAFRSGSQSSYCWNPASDPPPAESDQQCGDYWTFPLHLTTEWQLFLVPFTTMYQQGWAKRWSFFDTSSVSVVRLTWDKGWVDYWIDNLRFYRVRR